MVRWTIGSAVIMIIVGIGITIVEESILDWYAFLDGFFFYALPVIVANFFILWITSSLFKSYFAEEITIEPPVLGYFLLLIANCLFYFPIIIPNENIGDWTPVIYFLLTAVILVISYALYFVGTYIARKRNSTTMRTITIAIAAAPLLWILSFTVLILANRVMTV